MIKSKQYKPDSIVNKLKEYDKAKCYKLHDVYIANFSGLESFDVYTADELIKCSQIESVGKYKVIRMKDDKFLVKRQHDIDQNSLITDLPYGIYSIEDDPNLSTVCFRKEEAIFSDKYINLNDKSSDKIYNNITNFFLMKEKYKELNLLHKRGYLLYGPPGNGKSMFIKHITYELSKYCYIFYIQRDINWRWMAAIRLKFKDSMVIFVIEELTSQTTKTDVSDFLNFLDGSFLWNNCIVFATTNYPESLPNNIVDRPSRFDVILKFSNPTKDMRQAYITHLLGECSNYLVQLSEGHSLSYLKEMCLLSLLNRCGNDDVDRSLKNIETFRDYVKSKKNNENYV